MLDTSYQETVYYRTYSRWLPKERRRERWNETVDRYRDFFALKVPDPLEEEFDAAIELVRQGLVMPSMRALWTAGPALARENACGFNCAAMRMDRIEALPELLYLLMCGCGVGVSVERQFTSRLPKVPGHIRPTSDIIHVQDSKEGWAQAYRNLLEYLWLGFVPQWNLDRVRPKGARLRTFGGRASGPAPLQSLFDATVRTFLDSRGKNLTSEDVADLACKIASVVVVGGVRRSAILLMTNPSDRRMAEFKKGAFWTTHPHRAFANVSSVYTEKPSAQQFMSDFLEMVNSGCGERGFISREALARKAMKNGRGDHDWLLNPCGEIILRDRQFCNLTEVVVRDVRKPEPLTSQVKAAVLLGCLQATLTDYNTEVLSGQWVRNSVEEPLLGVSLTGLADTGASFKTFREVLRRQREKANTYIEKFIKPLGLNRPPAITCIKPSGTVSQLVGCSSGAHFPYSPYYVRRMRIAATDPVADLLIDSGIPHKPEVGETPPAVSTWVFEFPVKAKKSSLWVLTQQDVSAVDQFKWVALLRSVWADHNVSATISVKPDEWPEMLAQLWKQWDITAGVTFLPSDGGTYELAPYEAITRDEYEERVRQIQRKGGINWDRLTDYEKEDHTTGAGNYACTGSGGCEI